MQDFSFFFSPFFVLSFFFFFLMKQRLHKSLQISRKTANCLWEKIPVVDGKICTHKTNYRKSIIRQ